MNRRWPTFGATVLLVTPVAAMLVMAPVIAPAAASQPSAAPATIDPLPVPGPPADLYNLIGPLPLLARDLKDDDSRAAIAAYDGATIYDNYSTSWMLYYSLKSLQDAVPGSNKVGQLVTQLAYGNPDPDTAMGSVDDEPWPDLKTALDAALPELAGDAANAERLNNAAVALFLAGVANAYEVKLPLTGGGAYEDSRLLEMNAVWLLRATERTFGAYRPAHLNVAYLRSVQRTCSSDVGAARDAAAAARRQLAADPSDLTAQALAVEALTRADPTEASLQQALALIVPAGPGPAPSALDYALRGDARLTVATALDAAPFEARVLARKALSDYDRSLRLAAYSGTYTGRARALALLGELPQAVSSQAAAVALQDNQIGHLRLADLESAAGDFNAMREDARIAFMSGVADRPALSNLALTRSTGSSAGDLTDLNHSLGLWSIDTRDELDVWDFTAQGCGAGGYVVQQLIPRSARPGLPTGGTTLDRAAVTMVDASILLQDSVTGQADGFAWLDAINADQALQGTPDDAMARLDAISVAMSAAIVSQRGHTVRDLETLHYAENVMRSAGLFQATLRMCERVTRSGADTDGDITSDLLLCSGETAYLEHDLVHAAGLLAGAAVAAHKALQSDTVGQADLELAAVWQELGRREDARAIFLKGAVVPETTDISLMKLGELALDGGDPRGAIAYYDLALAGLDSQSLIQVAHNNRGIATMHADAAPGEAPKCSRSDPTCTEAAADFAEAIAIDPANPVYLVNAAWVARLRGDDTGARKLLDSAVAGDSGVFAAENDMAVMAARTNQHGVAKSELQMALEARPSYDLAMWNLGVLSLDSGPVGIVDGEALLGRATKLNPRLRGEPLNLQFDDRAYRVVFGADQPASGAWSVSHSYGVGAAVLGTVAAASITSAALGEVTGRVTELGGEVVRTYVGPVAAILRRRRPAWLRAPHISSALRPWLITLPFLALTTLVSAYVAGADAGWGGFILALYAVALAILMHESGHLLAAGWMRASVHSLAWPAGIVVSVVMLPFRASSGPYVGHHVEGASPDQQWWIYLAGPAANLIAALLALGAYLAQPLPFLLLVSQVQLAAAAFAVLPFDPLDGKPLSRRPLAAGVLAIAIAGVGAAIVFGTS